MSEEHITVKLSLSLLPDGRCRSRIDDAPTGASRGPGNDFELPLAPPEGYAKFLKDVGSGKRPANDLRELGKQLFRDAFANSVGEALAAARAHSQSRGAFLRVAVSVQSPELIPIPWEFLHDPAGYLLQKPKTHIVRVIDELRQEMAPFRRFTKLLVAVANPAGMARFNPDPHIAKIRGVLETMGVGLIEVFPARHEALLNAIDEEEFDAFYFLGHGQLDPAEGGVVFLEDPDGNPDPLPAPVLAQRLGTARRKVYFAYFNSCDTGTADGESTFSGVAQRILADGQLPAIVAQQAPVKAAESMRVAEAFLGRISRGESPEAALRFARTEAKGIGWGLPVLYTHLRGAEEFERNRLMALLQATAATRFSLCLATIIKGVRKRDINRAKIQIEPPEVFRYPGECHPRTAVRAAASVISLLTKIVPPDQIEFVDAGAETGGDATHQFYFGGHQVEDGLGPAGAMFRFTWGSEWVVTDTLHHRRYRVPDVSKLTPEQFEEITDYAFIEKLIDKDGRVLFGIAGFGDRSTRGAARYLADRWEEILQKHPTGSFGIVLQRRPHGKYHEMFDVDRMTGGEPVR